MIPEKTILIIDDERDFCALVILMLKSEPYHVDCAYNLKEASRFLKKEHPTIILLDHNLPDGTGLDFFTKTRSDFDASKTILITADPSPEIKRRAENAGIDFLAKPVELNEIRNFIKTVR